MQFLHESVISYLGQEWTNSHLRHHQVSFCQLVTGDDNGVRVNQRVVLNACNAFDAGSETSCRDNSGQRKREAPYGQTWLGDAK